MAFYLPFFNTRGRLTLEVEMTPPEINERRIPDFRDDLTVTALKCKYKSKLYFFIPSHNYVYHNLQLAVVQFKKILRPYYKQVSAEPNYKNNVLYCISNVNVWEKLSETNDFCF